MLTCHSRNFSSCVAHCAISMSPLFSFVCYRQKTLTLTRQFSVISNITYVFNNAMSGIRGSLVETLGKRMSKKDAELLQKYVNNITSPPASPPAGKEMVVSEPIKLHISDVQAEKESKVEHKETKYQDIALLHPVFGTTMSHNKYIYCRSTSTLY